MGNASDSPPQLLSAASTQHAREQAVDAVEPKRIAEDPAVADEEEEKSQRGSADMGDSPGLYMSLDTLDLFRDDWSTEDAPWHAGTLRNVWSIQVGRWATYACVLS